MKDFLDTNILIYAFIVGPRARTARDLLYKGGVISVQSLNEFAAVARRKHALPWEKLRMTLDIIRMQCPNPVALGIDVHALGLDIAQRHRFAVYDSMLLAAALHARCDTFWSEDLHDGLVIDGRLTVRNPFR